MDEKCAQGLRHGQGESEFVGEYSIVGKSRDRNFCCPAHEDHF